MFNEKICYTSVGLQNEIKKADTFEKANGKNLIILQT